MDLKNLREQELFDLIKSTVLPDLVTARHQFSKWDCYSPKSRARIELKCRRTHYDTLVIERKKYDALMDKAVRNNDRPLYINSTPNGVYSFDLSVIDEPDWFMKSMPETTEFSSRHYIKKEVGMLSVKSASNIKELLLNIQP